MRLGLLSSLLPDEFLVIVVLCVGLGILVRLLSLKAGMGILGTLVLSIVLAPFIEALMTELPAWFSLLILLALGFGILRGLVALLIGRRATDHMTGTLAADAVRLFFRLLFLPLRLIWGGTRRM
jgi:hypothetical protein